MLSHILAEAKRRSYGSVSLETGSVAAFAAAQALYARNGFVETAAFGDYVDNPYSLFMTFDLMTEDEV